MLPGYNYRIGFLLIALLIKCCLSQGPCPDGTPTVVTCTDGRSCPRDHYCTSGLCCPNCKRKSEDANNLPSVLGAYVPQCEPTGNYTPEQCHSSTGICWCVTENGQEIPNTKVSPGGIRRESCAGERLRFQQTSGGNNKATGSGTGTSVGSGTTTGTGTTSVTGSVKENNTLTTSSGQCPTPVGFGVCVNNCNQDADCSNFGRKCCSNGCGKQCMVPVGGGTANSQDEKAGTCPVNIGQLGTITGDECFIDTQCFGRQKCCQTSVGKKCLSPTDDTNTQPIDLGQGQQSVEQKTGFCPQVSNVGVITSGSFRNDRCINDRDCQNRLKCCDTINGKNCVDPFGQGQNVITPNQGQFGGNGPNGNSQCTGLNEEFKVCGEACPKSCDQLNVPTPSWCSGAGCVSGCYCKLGFIRLNSDPRSFCIPENQCQSSGSFFGNNNNNGPPVPGPFPGGKSGQCPTSQLHPAVAQTLTSGQAKLCNGDTDCQGDMKCCSTPGPIVLNSLRCLCADPNAFWRDCGSACPETCQQNPQICTLQCVGSCVCVDGYVRQSNALSAPCVTRNECGRNVPFGGNSGVLTSNGATNGNGLPPSTGINSGQSNSNTVTKATAKLESNLKVDGVLSFQQSGNSIRITGTVRGLQRGQHGIHIHTAGDLSNGCQSVGSHFDPDNQEHGGPQSSVRHVGDLGNVISDQNGITNIDITDSKISLNGVNSVLGRSIVIHEREDDLGRGFTPGSKQNGNAGQVVACGIIGIVQ